MIAHHKYMQQCIDLAKKANGLTSPNPLVGSVLVYDDEIIGFGYHHAAGEAHAEVNCINSVSAKNKHLIERATLYVNLEPCCHTGKTPPCANYIIQHSIKNVVIGCRDFSEKVNGTGIEILRNAGISVIEGVLENECIELNKVFFHNSKYNLPYIILKWAKTKDGFMANANKSTLKISNNAVDIKMHELRSQVDAIFVGYNTVVIDNPFLNVRHIVGKNPIRIVWDKELTLSKEKNIFSSSDRVIVFNSKKNVLENNIQFIQASTIQEILEKLFQQGIMSVLVEGGKILLEKFITTNTWDEVIEIENSVILKQGYDAPKFEHVDMYESEIIDNNIIRYFKKKED